MVNSSCWQSHEHLTLQTLTIRLLDASDVQRCQAHAKEKEAGFVMMCEGCPQRATVQYSRPPKYCIIKSFWKHVWVSKPARFLPDVDLCGVL